MFCERLAYLSIAKKKSTRQPENPGIVSFLCTNETPPRPLPFRPLPITPLPFHSIPLFLSPFSSLPPLSLPKHINPATNPHAKPIPPTNWAITQHRTLELERNFRYGTEGGRVGVGECERRWGGEGGKKGEEKNAGSGRR